MCELSDKLDFMEALALDQEVDVDELLLCAIEQDLLTKEEAKEY